jgi:hypothetical protein
MLVALVIAAVALVIVTIAWGSIMDLGTGGSHRSGGSRSRSHRHAA